MMINHNNSCRQDTSLAWLHLLINADVPNLFSQYDLRKKPFKTMSDCHNLMLKGEFHSAQEKFLNYLKTAKLDLEIGEFGSLSGLLERLFKDHFKHFHVEFIKKSTCTNKYCQRNEAKKLFKDSPFTLENLQNHRNVGKSIIGNWFHKYNVQFLEEEICSCNNSRIQSKNKNENKLEIEQKLVSIPEILLLSIETIFDENNKVLTNIPKLFEIDQTFNFEFDKTSHQYELCSMFILENNSHYTLLYKSPYFGGNSYDDWIYYNDLVGTIEYWEKEIVYSEMVRDQKIPIMLIYKLQF